MTTNENTVISSERVVRAPAEVIFELIADPARQPEWDGNDNLAEITDGGRIHAVGEVFSMLLTNGKVRDNHVVDFAEGARIAWRPASDGQAPAGHEWRWHVEALDGDRSRVTHIYDWTELADPARLERARGTTEDNLRASVDRLAEVAQASDAADTAGTTG